MRLKVFQFRVHASVKDFRAARRRLWVGLNPSDSHWVPQWSGPSRSLSERPRWPIPETNPRGPWSLELVVEARNILLAIHHVDN
jgi:hypothetical protein